MKPQNTQQTPQPAKAPSTKPSITGGILSVLALLSSGIANFFAYADANGRTHTEVTTAVGTVDSGPVAHIASRSVSAIISLPFIVGAVVFALTAIIFTLIRLRKVKATGLVLSVVWIVLSVWAIVVAIGALDTFRATPAN